MLSRNSEGKTFLPNLLVINQSNLVSIIKHSTTGSLTSIVIFWGSDSQLFCINNSIRMAELLRIKPPQASQDIESRTTSNNISLRLIHFKFRR
ncbi:hypothetical protein CEXT_609021 [Caerostris extrusa]|uniref:Uncharacterized protein n=1 Tax=Caerostris extrusa TaxID=172846 RepID=A0AAV4UG78_CAEEX|nr:hypothetical protein CEXT_609021 [Caerostris extrusa]